jgi:geranylgeranyl reductase family protein
MEPEFDVIVVGAGPGGATAAAFLARAGVRTLLLDKAHFPRDKACGDAVCTKSVRILRELGLVEAVEREICARVRSQVLIGPQGAALPLPFIDQVGRRREAGSVYVIRRERFDNVLFQHARSMRGVTAIEGFDFTDFLRDGARVAGVVGTDDSGREQRYRASIVIGADGAMSRVAQKAGAYDFKRKDHRHWIGAFRIYFQNVGGLSETLEIHFLDELLPGYLWIFPVGGGEANVGAGMVESSLQGRDGKAKLNLRRRTYEVLAAHPRLRPRFAGAREVEGSFRGWQLPCGSERRPLAGDGWMLIGDAASLIDPFSGEGISNAMHSAALASDCAVRALREGTAHEGGLLRYQKQVWEELGAELDTAYKLQRLARHRWLLRFVFGRAARPRMREQIATMMGDPVAASQLMGPGFYLKLLFA